LRPWKSLNNIIAIAVGDVGGRLSPCTALSKARPNGVHLARANTVQGTMRLATGKQEIKRLVRESFVETS
jgi:hypothetical protein